MATLDAKQRNAMTATQFAGPSRSYPVPDKAHAAVAKSRASEMFNKGKISQSARDRIFAKADAVLGKKG